MFIKVTVMFAVFLLIAGVDCQKGDFLESLTKGAKEFSGLLDKKMQLAKSATDLLEKKVDLMNQLSKNAESFGSLFNTFYDETE